VHEVTVGNFRAFVAETKANLPAGMGYNPATRMFVAGAQFHWNATGFPQTDNHPVVNVSWHDADAFCNWLSRKEKKKYRLPTEAEWEYACRAGSDTLFWFGDSENDLQGHANVSDASFSAKYPPASSWVKPWNDGFPFTAPVGSFKPNPFGLFDMHGNVQEWCADWYGDKYYTASPATDPKGPATGAAVEPKRVKRGGDYLDFAGVVCPSAFRRSDVVPAGRGHYIGFRVARDAE
jgi:formylglycine-generating enzyme required for sulfatase activity